MLFRGCIGASLGRSVPPPGACACQVESTTRLSNGIASRGPGAHCVAGARSSKPLVALHAERSELGREAMGSTREVRCGETSELHKRSACAQELHRDGVGRSRAR